MQITVVGAGVIGLTTALALEERGHDVRIIAAARGAQTTSDVAGAVWFPYRAGPPAKVAAWATGIEVTRAPAPVTGAPLAWRFDAPRVEPARFLPWLATQLRASIETAPVADLADVPGDLVINCTGLGARTLVGDPEISALFGQIVVTAPGAVDRTITVTDDRDPEAIFYLIPRRDELVLGGVTRPMAHDAAYESDPAVTQRILAHAAALGIPIGEVLRERTGLRPFRGEVRLERSGRVIHNYGHGGAGFTLCRGCAEDVAALAAGEPIRA